MRYLWCNVYCSRKWYTINRVQIQDKDVCILHSGNTLGKDINLIPLLPALGK